MSHQRYPSHDPIKEPHSVSVKVLRLSRPLLVTQYPVEPPLTPANSKPSPAPASLTYASAADTNPEPFLLSPILNLPVSFGSTYVGETFSCTLCANNDLPADATKQIRDVRIEAEMKTPGMGAAHKLELSPVPTTTTTTTTTTTSESGDGGIDLATGSTLQKIVSFDLKEEGNHVLAVTVSYYEASETSGRTRTFRKLYQFICKASLIVRTKVGTLDDNASNRGGNRTSISGTSNIGGGKSTALRRRRWVLEAQLENCSEDVMQLEKVVMDLEEGKNLRYHDCNWKASGSERPVLHPGEVEQVCFVVEEQEEEKEEADDAPPADGRITFGVLGIGWRGEMGSRGFLSTGKLGTRITAS